MSGGKILIPPHIYVCCKMQKNCLSFNFNVSCVFVLQISKLKEAKEKNINEVSVVPFIHQGVQQRVQVDVDSLGNISEDTLIKNIEKHAKEFFAVDAVSIIVTKNESADKYHIYFDIFCNRTTCYSFLSYLGRQFHKSTKIDTSIANGTLTHIFYFHVHINDCNVCEMLRNIRKLFTA